MRQSTGLFHRVILKKERASGAGEMAQGLKNFAFPEDLSLIPSTHTGWLTTSCNACCKGSSALHKHLPA